MATGTPRPALLHEKPSKETVKNWTSFDESPVHAGDGARKEEGWSSFKDPSSAVHPNEFSTPASFSSPAPAYMGKGIYPVTPRNQNTAPVSQLQESSILNRTGIGTDVPAPAPRVQPSLKHAPTETATHGPGSTINHLLRHKSADADSESVTDSPKPKDNVGAFNLLSTKSAGVENSKPTPDSMKYRQNNSRGVNNSVPDPWFVTEEQGKYYKNQFSSMQHKLDGKIDGQTARNFFTKSRLPIPELSHIWELCDVDQDGHLTLLEFCAAFHLVVARKNGFDLPPALPESLLPPLLKMFGHPPNLFPGGQKAQAGSKSKSGPDEEQVQPAVVKSPVKSKSSSSASKDSDAPMPKKRVEDHTEWVTQQEKWETFSDRTSSSTNLANFDQSLVQNDNLPHPVALRITPSRHELHSAKMRKDRDLAKSTDDDEGGQLKYAVPPSHKSLTNPYGSLQNDLSEADSHAGPRPRSSSHSSCSSERSSDRSLSEIEPTVKQSDSKTSDQEYQSDWSSRPLRPKSGSDSSIASSEDVVDGIPSPSRTLAISPNVPTPPPRPQQVKPVKADVAESDDFVAESDLVQVLSAPTPPPRPQQAPPRKPADRIEEFADFSRFDDVKIDESASAKAATESPTGPVTSDGSEDVVKSRSEDDPETKPTPAPRHNREEKSGKKEKKDSTSPDGSAHRKAPTKPPRSRSIKINEVTVDDTSPKIILSDLNDDLPVVAEKPSQDKGRSKADIQQSIRRLKDRNTKLTKLNSDLQQELKNVMQSRITVEMSIHHLRPFSQ